MKNTGPPRISAWLLACASGSDAGVLQGDLEEEFRTRVLPDLGRQRACRWYRTQVATSVSWLLLYATRDIAVGLACAVGALVIWQLTVYHALALGLGTDRPLGDLSSLAFTVCWVFAGAAVAGMVGVLVRPGRAKEIGALVGLIGLMFLLLGVDEPIGSAYRQSWMAAAMAGALLGAFLGRRWSLRSRLA